MTIASLDLSGDANAALPRTSPANVQIDPAGIAKFLDEVNSKVGGLHSMMLLRHGKVAAEAWWSPYQASSPHMLYSLSKSFTSTAVGLLAADGKLSVEDRVVSFFPEKLPAQVSENLAAMRVHDLLTMNTGHEKEPMRSGPDWVKSFLAAPVEHRPGSKFLYNTSATHVLAAIVQKLTGKRLVSFLGPRLFHPLGIKSPTWEQSPAGIDFGGSGLSVRTEDIAKFGQLYLQKGTWDGKELIPASWVAEATKKQVSNGDPSQPNDWSQGYGYQFWRCRHGHYRGDGAFGQYCIVMPELDAVLAITSGVGDMGAVMQAAWTHLLPAMSPSGSPGSDAELKRQLRAQGVPFPKGSASSSEASRVSGKTWQVEENPEGVSAVKLTFRRDRCVVETTTRRGTERVEYGLNDWTRGRLTDERGAQPIASRGAWTSENTFAVKSCLLEGPYEWKQAFGFDGDRLTVSGRGMNVGFGPTGRPDLIGRLA